MLFSEPPNMLLNRVKFTTLIFLQDEWVILLHRVQDINCIFSRSLLMKEAPLAPGLILDIPVSIHTPGSMQSDWRSCQLQKSMKPGNRSKLKYTRRNLVMEKKSYRIGWFAIVDIRRTTRYLQLTARYWLHCLFQNIRNEKPVCLESHDYSLAVNFSAYLHHQA